VAAAGAIANAFGRIIWGWLSDKMTFRWAFIVLTVSQAIVHTVYPYCAVSKATFMVAHMLVHILLAGNFAIFPSATVKLFGARKGTTIYGLIFSAYGIASLGGILISKVFSFMYLHMFCSLNSFYRYGYFLLDGEECSYSAPVCQFVQLF
jgi:MFS transporter, OFA family, oxalate/formate antiporter